MIIEHSVITGEIVEREETAEELAQYEADQAATLAQAELAAEKEAAKQAVLDRLGLTAEEAALLLGGN